MDVSDPVRTASHDDAPYLARRGVRPVGLVRDDRRVDNARQLRTLSGSEHQRSMVDDMIYRKYLRVVSDGNGQSAHFH